MIHDILCCFLKFMILIEFFCTKESKITFLILSNEYEPQHKWNFDPSFSWYNRIWKYWSISTSNLCLNTHSDTQLHCLNAADFRSGHTPEIIKYLKNNLTVPAQRKQLMETWPVNAHYGQEFGIPAAVPVWSRTLNAPWWWTGSEPMRKHVVFTSPTRRRM